MLTLKAVYKIVTPMFMGGADNINTAELRPPSFKGVLRFWYRAAASGNWKDIRENEQKLFGSTDTGQAGFLLKIQPEGKVVTISPGYQKWINHGAVYLGYGVIKPGKNETTRAYIEQGTRFTVTLKLRPQITESECADLCRALTALGLFGGLGSRSRRGFGSIKLESLYKDNKEIWAAPKNIEELKDKIDGFTKNYINMPNKEPDYTSFSSASRVSISASHKDQLSLLNEIGREMIKYRSYGRKKGKIRVFPWDEPVNKQIFADDHHLVRSVIDGNRPNSHPRRVVFGLPHNYFFLSDKSKVGINAKKYERRASPLFIHIHELTGQYAA